MTMDVLSELLEGILPRTLTKSYNKLENHTKCDVHLLTCTCIFNDPIAHQLSVIGDRICRPSPDPKTQVLKKNPGVGIPTQYRIKYKPQKRC